MSQNTWLEFTAPNSRVRKRLGSSDDPGSPWQHSVVFRLSRNTDDLMGNRFGAGWLLRVVQLGQRSQQQGGKESEVCFIVIQD